MSNTRHDTETDKTPLPRPVGEDGIVADRDEAEPADGADELDTGLADLGGGDRDKRKIA